MEIKNKHYIIGLLLIGFIVRVLAFQSGFMFTNDVNLFQFWGQAAFEHGLSQIYTAVDFIDYPPGYIYVLYVLGAMSARFGWERLSTIFNFFTFLPAILADLGIGYIIYRIAAYGRLTRTAEDKAENKEKPKDLPIAATIWGLKMAALWVLNPAVILISAVWGQVESVFVIFLLVSLLLLRERKIIASYILFGIAILIKAQSLFLGPIYLFTAITYLLDSKEPSELGGYKIPGKAYVRLFAAIGTAVALMAVLMIPFVPGVNIMPVIELYTSGLGTYPFASVNAFNFWALFGRNWVAFDNTFLGITYSWWGFIIALIIAALTFIALYRDRVLYEGRHFFLIVGALFALIFIFMVRMHERYLFPALTFFLVYYATKGEKRGLGIYAAFSVTFFFNCTEILRWLRGGFTLDIIANSTPIISFANVVLGGILIYMFIKSNWMGKPSPMEIATKKKPKKATSGRPKVSRAEYEPIVETKVVDPPPMGAKDYVFLFVLIGIYSFIAFFRLGDFNAPQTAWAPEQGEYAIIDFGEAWNVTEMQYRMSAVHDRPFTISASVDGEDWEIIDQLNTGATAVFTWQDRPMHFEARYIRVFATGVGVRIQELAFRGPNRELIPIYSVSPGGEALVDEQQWVPDYRSFMNSAYFDEIYHPRAAYEYLHGLNVFETTHPPMGKNFIMWSIQIFGMTPFGWRFAGTLTGVLMVPLIYVFARFLFKSNNWALFAATIFTFDFMHFAQTRL
ncbi:MAG: glycosyltransferase family 39 protein, partial [Defluviitaleaceae bacterium]|nr:glycosyltransferase family 39 protein [Defluviitaleaceae bacterium]